MRIQTDDNLPTPATRSTRQPRVIAHRGASAIAPENTLLAFRLAIEHGADMIETDAHLTRDGEVVLIHDSDLRRTTNCGGSVTGMRLADLRACDAGYWFTPPGQSNHAFRGLGLTVPCLMELLTLTTEAGPSVEINVEIKNPRDEINYDPSNRLAQLLVNLLREAGAIDRVLISSFNADAIDRVRELDPTIRTALLCGPQADLHARTAYACARGHSAIHPQYASLGTGDSARRMVEMMHAAALEVNVWTVNDPQAMRDMAAAGVDGIITDDPGRLRRILEREESVA